MAVPEQLQSTHSGKKFTISTSSLNARSNLKRHQSTRQDIIYGFEYLLDVLKELVYDHLFSKSNSLDFVEELDDGFLQDHEKLLGAPAVLNKTGIIPDEPETSPSIKQKRKDSPTPSSMDSVQTVDVNSVNTWHRLPVYPQASTRWIILRSCILLSMAIWATVFWPVILILWLWYEFYAVRPVKLYCARTWRNVSLLKRCPSLQARFRPTPYTALIPGMSGHLQTFFNEFMRPPPPMNFQREFLNLDDGGSLALDYYPSSLFNDSTPTMLVIHGVTGGSHSTYVRHYVRMLVANGLRPVVMNARGCGTSKLTTPIYFSCHFTDDVRRVVNHVHQKFPDAPLFATAYSLGANVLTKYLGEEGSSTPLIAAITVANPFDWVIIDKWLEKPVNRHSYNYILTKSLTSYLRRHRDVFHDHETIRIDDVLKAKTLAEYDMKITCPLWGYETRHQYYEDASGKNYLDNVKIPMLVIQALDDPILPEAVIPYTTFFKNPNIMLATTFAGGHLAWLEGLNPSKNNFADRVCVEFTHSVLDHVHASQIS